MSLDVDLIAKLQVLAGAAVPVQQNYASSDKVQPRVFVQSASGNVELLNSGTEAALGEAVYTVEVAGLDPDATAAIRDALVATYPAGLNGFRGLLNGANSTRTLGVFVEDASDDYQPRMLDVDDGYHVFAFQVRVLT